MQELIFINTATLIYTRQEIWFPNSGILGLLGVFNIENEAYSLLYLSPQGTLSYLVNRDPLYSSYNMIDLYYTEKINSFISCNLEKNGKQEFLLGYNGTLIWINKENNDWTSKTVFGDGVLKTIMAQVTSENSNDLFLLYNDTISWATEVVIKTRNDGFNWESNGDIMAYHSFNIVLEQNYEWDTFQITVFFK